MAANIPYNDDVNMTIDDSIYNQNDNSNIDDDSSSGSSPSVDPIDVSDTTTRPTDGWTKNLDPNAGTKGEEYNDTAPTEKDPVPAPVYKTVTRKTRFVIQDYSPSYLQQLSENGAKFYVVYTDGTENEVSYNEIYDPHQIHTEVYVNEALAIAEATDQHFWHDDNGAHVTDVEQNDWKTAAANNFDDLSDSKPYHNILMNSLGILLRRALYNLVSISKSAITFYDGLGNNLANIRASFGSSGATFRESGKTKATVTTQGLSVYDNSGSVSGNSETLGNQVAFIGIDSTGKPYSRIGRSDKGFTEIGVNSNDNGYIDFYNNDVLLAHIGYDAGVGSDGTISNAPYYNFGKRKNDSKLGNYSVVEGVSNTASGYCSHAEGYYTTASGYSSHAEGYYTTASGHDSHVEGYRTTASGDCSHAEGYYTTASGYYSHAEGYYTTAIGNYSHAEGYYTTAHGDRSHAEGDNTTASGYGSHAEGYYTTASGNYSHASGSYTIADKQAMTAIGFCNREGIANAIFAVGNGIVIPGSTNARRNAFTIIGAQGSTATAYVGGSTTSNGSTVTSDERIKTLIENVPTDKAIQFIQSITPRMYYKEESNPNGELGFYAQEVEKTIYGDQLVTKDNSGIFDLPDFRILSYEGFIAPIVSVEQNLLDRVEKLEKENELLRNQNEEIVKKLDTVIKMLND